MLCTLAHDVEAFVNAMDSVGQTALMLAITVGALNLVEILLNKGAKINVTDKTGASALHIAIRCYIDRSVDGIDFMNFIALLLHKVPFFLVSNRKSHPNHQSAGCFGERERFTWKITIRTGLGF